MLAEEEFRKRLVEELDDAFSLICAHKKYSDGLEAAADQMEEFLFTQFSSLLVRTLLGIEKDVTGLSRQVLQMSEELEKRRAERVKRYESLKVKELL